MPSSELAHEPVPQPRRGHRVKEQDAVTRSKHKEGGALTMEAVITELSYSVEEFAGKVNKMEQNLPSDVEEKRCGSI